MRHTTIGQRLKTCPLCEVARATHILTQNGYQVFRCGSCCFEFVQPVPTREELAGYYDQSYAVPLERYARTIGQKQGRIARLERWQPVRGRLLEVGASYGYALVQARERGWQVVGVELSPTASKHARESLGLEVFTGDLLEATLEPCSFDAAVMWHVLEHTQDPQAQLTHLRALLRPGGILGIAVPNVTSFGAWVAGRSWPWMCPPAHLWYFSPRSLPYLLAKCGFEVLEVATLRGDGNNLYQHTIMALGSRLNALRRWMQRRASTEAAGAGEDSASLGNPPAVRHAWLALLARAQPVTDLLARWTRPVLEPLEAAGWGDELLCYARRPSL